MWGTLSEWHVMHQDSETAPTRMGRWFQLTESRIMVVHRWPPKCGVFLIARFKPRTPWSSLSKAHCKSVTLAPLEPEVLMFLLAA